MSYLEYMRAVVVACAAAVIGAACSGDSTLPELRTGTPVDSTLPTITVTPSSITLAIGDTAVFVAHESGCGTAAAPLSWRLSNDTLAVLQTRNDSTTWLQARAGGNVTLIATCAAPSSVIGAAAITITK